MREEVEMKRRFFLCWFVSDGRCGGWFGDGGSAKAQNMRLGRLRPRPRAHKDGKPDLSGMWQRPRTAWQGL